MDKKELEGKIVVGEFLDRDDRPEFSELYWSLIKKKEVEA